MRLGDEFKRLVQRRSQMVHRQKDRQQTDQFVGRVKIVGLGRLIRFLHLFRCTWGWRRSCDCCCLLGKGLYLQRLHVLLESLDVVFHQFDLLLFELQFRLQVRAHRLHFVFVGFQLAAQAVVLFLQFIISITISLPSSTG